MVRNMMYGKVQHLAQGEVFQVGSTSVLRFLMMFSLLMGYS